MRRRIERFFDHRCTMIIPDGVVIGQDPYGKDITEDKEIKKVPCRVDQIRKRTSRDEYGIDYITQNLLYLGKDKKVDNDSRFKDFVDREGNAVIKGEYRVEEILPAYKRRSLNHYEVTLIEGS